MIRWVFSCYIGDLSYFASEFTRASARAYKREKVRLGTKCGPIVRISIPAPKGK